MIDRDARQRGRAPPSAPERGREQVLHVRPRPAELPLDEPPGSRRSPDGASRRVACRGATGMSQSAAAAQLLDGKRAFVARVAQSLERGAVSSRRARRRRRAAGRVPRTDRARKRRCRVSRISRCARIARRTVRGAELLGFTRTRYAARRACSGRRARRRGRRARRRRRGGAARDWRVRSS